MIKFKDIETTYREMILMKQLLSISCYLDPWTSLIIEAPGSQPVCEMWDLYLLFLTSVRGDFIPRPVQAATGPWMSRHWELSFCHLDVWLCCPPQGTWLTRSTGCAHAMSWSHQKLLPLARPDHLEKEMATHSSTLAWKIPWTEEPGGLQSMGSRRVGHDWETSLSLFDSMHWRRKWQPTPVFLPGESQGQGSLVGCHLWGCTESDMTEAT